MFSLFVLLSAADRYCFGRFRKNGFRVSRTAIKATECDRARTGLRPNHPPDFEAQSFKATASIPVVCAQPFCTMWVNSCLSKVAPGFMRPFLLSGQAVTVADLRNEAHRLLCRSSVDEDSKKEVNSR